ncbi:MAG: hypothetical protein JSS20_20125 [Proteobacteria bacterium]|nr:hypothetical protein [Pseudomonadota bacterium]
MTNSNTPQADDQAQSGQGQSGFFINTGTHSGWFTTPDGDIYDIRKLEPREVTDRRSGEVTTIWGGYASARDRDLAAKDAMLQDDFKRTGQRPAEFFQPEARDIPLYITLRNRPGKVNPETGKPTYTDIGSFWNSKGRYTVLARDLAGKSGLRFGGNVLAYKPAASAEMTNDAMAAAEPDGSAAHARAGTRARKGRDKAPSADA